MKQITLSKLSKELQALIIKEVSALEKVTSSAAGSYWDKKGDFQEEYNQIRKDFIPSHGEAKNPEAELVRAVERIYYDCYNNGWGNDSSKEANTLKAEANEFQPFYKGKTPLPTLLRSIGIIQEHLIAEENLGDSDEYAQEKLRKYIQDISTDIEPHLDNLMDAVVQYAYGKLYSKTETSTSIEDAEEKVLDAWDKIADEHPEVDTLKVSFSNPKNGVNNVFIDATPDRALVNKIAKEKKQKFAEAWDAILIEVLKKLQERVGSRDRIKVSL